MKKSSLKRKLKTLNEQGNRLNPSSLLISFIKNVLTDSADFHYRKLCRAYSKTFFTPLHEVYQLPYVQVYRDLMENRIEEMDEETMLNFVSSVVQNNDRSEEALLQEQIQRFLKEEETKKVKKKRVKKQVVKKDMTPDLPEVKKVFDFKDEEF